MKPRRWPPLRHDVERELTFYRLVVSFRNAVELMMITRGRPLDPDRLFWGFGGHEHPPRRRRSDADDWSDTDDDGLAGSRVPKRPHGGTGAASVELEPPFDTTPEEQQVELGA